MKTKKKKLFIILFALLTAVLILAAVFIIRGRSKKRKIELPVKIALIDTGISKYAINEKYIGSGHNYVTNDDNTMDNLGHGTAVAGIIVGSEKAGITGVVDNVLLIPLVCSTLDDDEKTQFVDISTLSQMIRDAVDIYECSIINVSSGIKTDYDELKAAVEYATSKGALVISCAGNEGTEAVYYPGGYEDVICVGSLNETLSERADFSQNNNTVDVLAPGEKISVSTIKGNTIPASGTSYSAAYFTGCAAKIWSENPGYSVKKVMKKLKKEYKNLKFM